MQITVTDERIVSSMKSFKHWLSCCSLLYIKLLEHRSIVQFRGRISMLLEVRTRVISCSRESTVRQWMFGKG